VIGYRLGVDALVEGVLAADRAVLGRALSLTGSALPADKALAQQMLVRLVPHVGAQATIIGITGPPGAGKSTLIEALGMLRVSTGHKLAVLAIDPTSPQSGGSILGDKTRMDALARHPLAVVRPAPSGGHLGGTIPTTREDAVVCHAAGFDTVLVETVGVGQSETEVASVADMTILVLPPAAGDELQGVKRGIVEIADLILINKADGDLAAPAAEAQRQYAQALHLFPPREDGWQVPVLGVSAQTGAGLAEVWPLIDTYIADSRAGGGLEARRQAQRLAWFRDCLGSAWRQALVDSPHAARFAAAEQQVQEGSGWPPALAAEAIAQVLKGGL
jgi:LAO/AO transport system kinase